MPYTTGLITNTRATGTAASNVVVSVRNTSNASAMMIVEVFGVPYSMPALTPIYVTGYYVPAKSSDIREFFIGGNLAYEVQISSPFPLAEVVTSVYGLDEFGNLVTDQRVLQSELTQITALSIPI
ncbi:hypothetical protein MHH60_18385 [Paenibacillus sp. FSL H7-0716]|uniref:Uncharacterized protein n=1 Tax=Paenibacillus odorifer TaxID=189426 RepID=A0A1R0YVW8_9BACL|nr:hypothetical protein [Paenibacillus odorifer]AWV35366.1 hypothetical protein CD191_23505 [Paenibacillus odorifer]OME11661.1 hypothetical protein BSK60_20685 [Paenibacillus odorifer]OME14663.1 hypothetical protein BSK47_22935 [Paenibacillus odorifer]